MVGCIGIDNEMIMAASSSHPPPTGNDLCLLSGELSTQAASLAMQVHQGLELLAAEEDWVVGPQGEVQQLADRPRHGAAKDHQDADRDSEVGTDSQAMPAGRRCGRQPVREFGVSGRHAGLAKVGHSYASKFGDNGAY